MQTEKEIQLLRELGYDSPYKIRVKPVTTPPKTPDTPQGRDTFETPNYAVDLLIPFIPKEIKNVWECAAGNGKISKRLERLGYETLTTDIRYNPEVIDLTWNFLNDGDLRTQYSYFFSKRFCIITNPPFSIKAEFIEKAFEYDVPFAFLINADYSGQSIEWIQRGCEKIIPTRRIAYITPNIIERVHEGEVWEVIKNDPRWNYFKSLKEIKENGADIWRSILEKDEYKNIHNYLTKDEIPQNLLYKYSSAQFHSMWLTYGFGLRQTEVFVDLPIKELKENI